MLAIYSSSQSDAVCTRIGTFLPPHEILQLPNPPPKLALLRDLPSDGNVPHQFHWKCCLYVPSAPIFMKLVIGWRAYLLGRDDSEVS